MSPSDYVRYARQQAEEQLKRTSQALGRSAARGAREARQRTADVGAVDSHQFEQGWKPEVRADGGYAIVNTAPHAPWADDGRPPGSPPPIAALVRWVERRFRVGGPEAWAIARSIAEKIAQRGTKGAKVLEWVARRLEVVIIPQEIEKELNR